MTQTVDTRMKQSAAQARRKLESMKQAFNRSAGETDLKTRGTFDISELGKAFSIAQKAAEDTNRIIKEREVAVHTLDVTCRALLPQNPSIDAIADVYYVIRDLNEFEVKFSLSTSLNHEELASGSSDLDASLTAKMIEAFWEREFTNHPDHADYLRRESDRKAQEKKRQADQKAQARNELASRQDEIKRAKKHYEDFKADGERRKAEYEKELEQELGCVREQLRASIDQTIRETGERLSEKRRELDSLGLFAFSRKKECKAEIGSLEGKLILMRNPGYIDEQLAPYRRDMSNALDQYASALKRHVERSFVNKEFPNYELEAKAAEMKPVAEAIHGSQGDKLLAQEILDTLEWDSGGMTEIDVLNQWIHYGGSSLRILQRLATRGYVKMEYTKDGTRYYHYRDKRYSKISVPMPDPQYENTPWPEPRSAASVLKWPRN